MAGALMFWAVTTAFAAGPTSVATRISEHQPTWPPSERGTSDVSCRAHLTLDEYAEVVDVELLPDCPAGFVSRARRSFRQFVFAVRPTLADGARLRLPDPEEVVFRAVPRHGQVRVVHPEGLEVQGLPRIRHPWPATTGLAEPMACAADVSLHDDGSVDEVEIGPECAEPFRRHTRLAILQWSFASAEKELPRHTAVEVVFGPIERQSTFAIRRPELLEAACSLVVSDGRVSVEKCPPFLPGRAAWPSGAHACQVRVEVIVQAKLEFESCDLALRAPVEAFFEDSMFPSDPGTGRWERWTVAIRTLDTGP